MVILKLDFGKAFDKIEYQTIINLLEARGFGRSDLPGSEIFFILAHQRFSSMMYVGKLSIVEEVLDNRDPLSPLLFVLA